MDSGRNVIEETKCKVPEVGPSLDIQGAGRRPAGWSSDCERESGRTRDGRDERGRDMLGCERTWVLI